MEQASRDVAGNNHVIPSRKGYHPFCTPSDDSTPRQRQRKPMDQIPSSSKLRPLLPGPSSGSSSREREQPPGEDSRVPFRRVTVTAACEPCRRRKIKVCRPDFGVSRGPTTSRRPQSHPLNLARPSSTHYVLTGSPRGSKCDAGRPTCTACARTSRSCVYSTEPSESRGAALKRKYADIEGRLSEYEQIFNQLKTQPLQGARKILLLIRSGENVSSILGEDKQEDLPLQANLSTQDIGPSSHHIRPRGRRVFQAVNDPYEGPFPANMSKAETYAYSESLRPSNPHPAPILRLEYARDAPYYTAHVVDPRLRRICASSWTAVTDDDELVARLLGLYLQWEFPLFQFFQKDLFLDDLVSEQKRFCSPLLVNAILASAAHGFAEDVERAKFWAPGSLAYAFMAECKRLWETEVDSSQLTTIQTASILSLRHTADGADKLGMAYLRRAVTMAEGIELFTRREPKNSEMGLARAVTAWGLFSWQSICCFYLLGQPIVMEPPATPLPDPPSAPTLVGELYVQYPPSQTLVPIFLSQCFCAFGQLRALMMEVMLAAQPTAQSIVEHSMSAQEATHFRNKLLTWYNSLPVELQAKNVVLPHQLHVHMGYHIVLTKLLDPLRGNSLASESPPRLEPDLRATSLTTWARLETLVHIYQARHGFGGPDILLLFSLLFLSSGAIGTLKVSSRPPEDYDTVYLCARGLQDQGKSNYLGILMFCALMDSTTTCDGSIQNEFARIRAEIPAELMQHNLSRPDFSIRRWIDLHRSTAETLSRPSRDSSTVYQPNRIWER
ncbi:hypothetical protein HIM_06791 [Hirsutella minnesotensis 3608]|uniref:Xylanolytic transcriptional activator regulatory domain-containing protein n=1 Tax=Hirsutella minnesotensis 3608 TaxID=1043627 RepID=A0A0F7ZTY0_9HYPO|nr:hypothetical protein HIM_06791 [Hirsutella minnesotensis 3608]